MNLDSASSASSGAPPNTRRGAIAIQACDTCRSRKQKCDEQRPKCGLCQRMKLECRYREPQPTKKDKTLVEILDRLKSLETKVDRIPTRGIALGLGPPQTSPSSVPSLGADVETDPSPVSYQASSLRPSSQPSSSDATGFGKNHPYRHASAAHKMLTWPAIQQLLLQSVPSTMADLKSLEQEGSAFIVRMQKGMVSLPMEVALQSTPFLGMQTQASRAAGGSRAVFPALTRERMIFLSTAYFDSFNFLYPFMDRQNFISDTLTKVYTEGFNGDADSIIALLIFALGEIAIEGSQGPPIETYNGRASGVKGGTAVKPPGLEFFNAARERIGFVLTECDLESVQIFSLAALYNGSCSRHVDFWRLTVSASSACQVLITCNPIDWSSPRGDLIKRAYWHCAIMETGLHLELDLPLTGIIGLEDRVGMPSFNSPFCEADHRGNQASHFEAHYASQVALRRLCANLHDNINDSMSSTAANTPESSSAGGGPTANTLRQMAAQLTQWRGLLPPDLQWNEDDSASYPNPTPSAQSRNLDPNLAAQKRPSRPPMFTADLDSEPVPYQYAYDIQVALLRTRYYYAKYMVHRPFVYKALHFPEQMTQEDAEGAAECLKSCLNWPLTLSPASRRKRLVPYLFCWSQNFLGILLIIHLTQHNPMMRDIRNQLCGPNFDQDVGQSIDLMLDWIRDLKSSDPISMWCWNILKGVYRTDG